jgi:hypothetical protein
MHGAKHLEGGIRGRLVARGRERRLVARKGIEREIGC